MSTSTSLDKQGGNPPGSLPHGGRLRQAVRTYGIPLEDWLDLSTGNNPHGWPVPALPAACWQRLPEENDGLETVAALYYRNANLLPVAGSQAAIQLLPHLLPRGMVACLGPLYDEHQLAWQRAGHRTRLLPSQQIKRALTAATPYVLLCNPNNPTANLQTREALVDAADQLKKRGGWLIVDEAFIDPTPEQSVTALAGSDDAPNLIVLRSLGKFFGLSGLRLGFVFATPALLQKLATLIGPWSIAGPSRAAAQQALADTAWQDAMRPQLHKASQRLQDILAPFGPLEATPLFASLTCTSSTKLHEHLARRGILTRLIEGYDLLRFGLPAAEHEWQRLQAALDAWKAK